MKAKTIAVVVAAGAAIASSPALAHVSLHPNTVPEGAFVTLSVRVPGEVAGAHATKVDTLFPPGFTDVSVQNVPGWTYRVIMQNVSPPIQTDSGPVNQEISQIVWTWVGPLGRIANNEFMQFPLSIAMPDNGAGTSLAFKTLESYSDGSIARWIGPPSANYPAPTINVTPKGGLIEEVAGNEAGPTPGEAPAGTAASALPTPQVVKSSNSASKGLGIAALVIGIFALIIGLVAAATARRRTPREGTAG
jgi:uncharacterized protein YcnI